MHTNKSLEAGQQRKLDTFTEAYITCALWSSNDNADDSGGDPLDKNYSASDISEETMNRMIEDCASFQSDNSSDLERVSELADSARAGHDFWLNRNGHGSGFWDEYFGKDTELYAAFQRLSDASKAWGSFDLYIGDDSQIHGS